MTNIMKRNNNGNGREATKSLMPFGGWPDSILNTALSRFFEDDFWGFDGNVGRSQVPVNVRETEAGYELEIIAPGMKKEDFKVNLSNNLLTVSFDHKQEQKDENKQTGYVMQEYRVHSFQRSFNLDDTIDAEKITARYEDGVLHLSLQKKEGARNVSRVIDIQ